MHDDKYAINSRKQTANKRIPDKIKQSLQDEDIFNQSVDDYSLFLNGALNQLENLDSKQAKVVVICLLKNIICTFNLFFTPCIIQPNLM